MRKIKCKKNMMILELLLNILWIYILTFSLRPMTFTVIDNRIFYPTQDSVLFFVSNTMIFLIQCLCVSSMFLRKTYNQSLKRFFKIFFTKILFKALVVRVVIDIVFMILETLPFALLFGSIKIILEAFFYWYLFSLVSKKLECIIDVDVKSRKSSFIIGCAWTCGFALIYLFYAFGELKTQESIYAKYINPMTYIDAVSGEFKLQLINLIFNVGLVIILFIYFGLFRANEKKIKDYNLLKFVIRSTIWLLLALIILSAKAVVLPHGMMGYFGSTNKETEANSSISYNDIDMDFSTFYIDRQKNYSVKDTVYKRTKIFLKQGNDIILSFDNKKSEDIGELIRLEVSNLKFACRYEFDAIAYIDGETSFGIETKDINSYDKKDENLIIICERLIDEGSFEMFQFSYEYLLKYDKDYIKSFVVEQQQSGWDAFYCNETNEHLHFDYISNAIEKIESNLIDLLKL